MITHEETPWSLVRICLVASFIGFAFGYLLGSARQIPGRQFGKEPKRGFNYVTNSSSVQVPQTLSETPKEDKNFTISQ